MSPAPLSQVIRRNEESMIAMIPESVGKQRLFNALCGIVATERSLDGCDPQSVMRSAIDVARFGLDIGIRNQAWLIGRYDKKAGGKVCKVQLGYGGLLTLAKRSGEVKAVHVELVREKDQYERDQDSFTHHWDPFAADRGEVIGAYCVLELGNGAKQIATMSLEEIQKVAATSESFSRGYGPWVDHWGEMAKKTVLIRALKLVTMDAEAGRLVQDTMESDSNVQATVVKPHRQSGLEATKALLAEGVSDGAGDDPEPGVDSDLPPADVPGEPPADPKPAKKKATKKKRTANRPIRQEDVSGEELFDGKEEDDDPFADL